MFPSVIEFVIPPDAAAVNEYCAVSVQGTLTTNCSAALSCNPYVLPASLLTPFAATAWAISENISAPPRTVAVIKGNE